MIAAIRSAENEWGLLVHLVGAMTLVGGMLFVLLATGLARRRPTAADVAALDRLSFRTLLFVVWPGLIVTFLGAVLLEDGHSIDDAWVAIGLFVTELGAVLLVLPMTVLTFLSARRAARAGDPRPAAGLIATVLAATYLLLLLVVVWAMTVKPT